MKERILIGLCLGWINLAQGQYQQQTIFGSETGAALLDSLVEQYKPVTVLDYDDARDTMFANIYRLNDSIECVYTGHRLYLPLNTDPSTAMYRSGVSNGINTEHTYPQSKGARYGAPKSDLHHLFPTRTGANSARSNYPFAELLSTETTSWYCRTQVETSPSIGPEQCSQVDTSTGRFTPRFSHRGNVARAVFYFYTMYKAEADAADPTFFANQISDLCNWHLSDPVDSLEWARTFRIADYQDGRPNPFVLDCTLPMRTYCPHLSTGSCLVATTVLPSTGIRALKPFPNPAMTVVTFEYTLEAPSEGTLVLYNSLGKEVLRRVQKDLPAGEGNWEMNLLALPNGCYTYQWCIQQAGQTALATGRLVVQH